MNETHAQKNAPQPQLEVVINEDIDEIVPASLLKKEEEWPCSVRADTSRRLEPESLNELV